MNLVSQRDEQYILVGVVLQVPEAPALTIHPRRLWVPLRRQHERSTEPVT